MQPFDKNYFVVMSRRGNWDRAASASDRAIVHREAMTRAAARALFEVGRRATVSDVVDRAGVGRNTLYAHFRDLDEVLRASEADALAMGSRAFVPPTDARTPIERLRAIASQWLALAESEPHFVMLALRGDGRPGGAPTTLRETIESALERVVTSARAAGIIGQPVLRDRLRAAAGAFVAAADAVIAEPTRLDKAALAEELVAFSLRNFR